MKRLLLWLTITFTIPASLFAGNVNVRDAGRAALNFYFERVNEYKPTEYLSLRIRETFTVKEDADILYYVFNLGPEGYVVVSGDYSVRPVLAYSFETGYRPDSQPPQFVAWMKQYAAQIRFAITEKISPSPEVKELWKHLLEEDQHQLTPLKSGRDVLPLLYSTWDQVSPYNVLCPADPSGPGGHALAGCVPTAMGQIMYYYRWPDHGTGGYTDADTTYGRLHVNYDSTWYEWNNMRNSITDKNRGIAELLYTVGVACDLVYGPAGSGMYNHKSAYALRTFLKYSPETQYVFRDSTHLNWDSLIIAHLDRGMPLYYAGWSVPNVNGHAFVCDGYQGNDFFHFNFGWSGSANGYFYPDAIVAGGGSFNLAQEMIINIYPDTLHYSYPSACAGSTHLTYTEGSLDDGSGPLRDYKTGSDCSWLIDPQTDIDSISNIILTFDNFDTSQGDSLFVYNGGTTDSGTLGAFSGSTIPSMVSGTSNKMLIRFRTTGNNPAPGWSATYSSVTPGWCRTSATITADTLDLTDGSLRFNYHNNTNCRWNLKSKSGDTLTLFFKAFDTEPLKDVVRIYDAQNMDTLAIISGHYDSLNLPPPVSSPSGKILLMFLTNDSITGKGWNIYYPRSTTGVRESNPQTGLQVFPNPATDRLNLRFSTRQATKCRIQVSTIEGIPSRVEEFMSAPGSNLKTLDIHGLVAGVYLLTLRSADLLSTRKIVITR